MVIETKPDLSSDSNLELQQRSGEISRYVKYLPGIYSEDDFTARFLSIFESVSRPIENTFDSLPSYFEPGTAPVDFLGWIGGWLNLELLEVLPEGRRRSIVKESGKLFKWKGTHFGLTSLLELYTGLKVHIEEQLPSFTLSEDALLGTNTILGDGIPYNFIVRIWGTPDNPPNIEHINHIVSSEKPANTNYQLKIISID